MEDIQRLASEVAAAYLRHLKFHTGSNEVTYDGVTKGVDHDELSFAIAGVAYYNANNHPEHPDLKDPHKHISLMIDVFSKPYRITEYGLSVIESLNEKSIHKEQGRAS